MENCLDCKKAQSKMEDFFNATKNSDVFVFHSDNTGTIIPEAPMPVVRCRKHAKPEFLHITQKQRKELKVAADYTCAICKIKKSPKSIVIDHCHTSGEIRGVLCTSCNLAIGLFLENEKTLNSAIEYLRQPVSYLK